MNLLLIESNTLGRRLQAGLPPWLGRHREQAPHGSVQRGADQPAGASTVEVESGYPRVGLGKLVLIFLWLGSISIGGRSIGYVRNEMVERRGWMRVSEFLEGMSFAQILPGPMGPNLTVFVGRMLGGRLGAAVSVLAYVLPGAVAILAVTALGSGIERTDWMDGALQGAGAAALGLLVSICFRNVGTARTARFGLLFASLAALGNGMGLPLVGLLLVLGVVSLYVNRPRPKGA